MIRLYPFDEHEQVWSDDFMIGRTEPDTPKTGLLVEVVHHTVDFMAQTIQAVVHDYNPDLLKQNLVAVMDHSIPLAGQKLLSDWKSHIQDYPNELAVAVIQHHVQIDHFWRWQMRLARGDNRFMLYQVFNQVQHKLLHILLALNKKYYYGFKWVDEVIANFEIAPQDFLNRFKSICHLEPAQAAQELIQLVEETYILIEQHHTEIDVAWLRYVFRYQRPVLETAPSLDG